MERSSSSTKLGTSTTKSNKYSKGPSPLDPAGKMSNSIRPSKELNQMPMSPGSSSTCEADGDNSEIGSPSGDNIQVVVRVRPLSQAEKERKDQDVVNLPGEGAIWMDNNLGQTKPFTFNKVFSADSSQEKVFHECGIKHLIDMALEGYSCTVLAFGQTGSGKTYTITGPVNLGSNWDENMDILPATETFGLMQRSFRYLIKQMSIKKSTFTLKASYLEVYNEKVKDLLELSSSRDSLVVRWSTDRGFYVEDLFCVKCENEDDLMAVLEEGLRNRQVRAHCINDHSSRSHCMLTLHLDNETCEPEDDNDFVVVKYGRLCFVDLAGSERVKETKSSGELFTESQNINKSLLTLGNCISALSDTKKRNGYIPYRDSKLTKLLAKSIGGDGMTLMISCISPSSYFVYDTLNTLRYAQRAKKIKNKPVVQMDPKEKFILSLKREIKLLRKENFYFKNQLGISTPESSRPSTVSISGEESWTDDGGESLTATPMSNDEEDRTSTPWQTLSANRSTRMPPGLYDMLQEYMMENENLRTENGDLHTSRDTMRRHNLVISRENEELIKKLESRSSSAASSSPRLGRVRSLTDDPKLLGTPSTSQSTSTLLNNNSTGNNDRASDSACSSTTNKEERAKDPGAIQPAATASNVVSLPPVRQTRSNPISEKPAKTIRQPQSQQTLLNIQKDVEWLAKHQSMQRSNASQSKQPTNNEVEDSSSNREDDSSKQQANGPTTSITGSVKMSCKIPQRVKEQSTYARIFAKHKAGQPRKDEAADEVHETSTNQKGAAQEEPLQTHTNTAGILQGTSEVPPDGPAARAPKYPISSHQGQLRDPNDKLRADLDVLANQINYYRYSNSETQGVAPKTRR